ncbi:MAG: hypothetical protein V3R79_00200, partial [Alphaproteobacteria bacterium]
IRRLEPVATGPSLGMEATCLRGLRALAGAGVVFASGVAVTLARGAAATSGGGGGGTAGAAVTRRGAGIGLRTALGGAGIGGMAVRGGAAVGFGFFITVGGARGGAFRFAVARDLGLGLVRGGTTPLAVPRRLPVGFALAGEDIVILGWIRGLAAGITTEGFGAIDGAAAVRRVDRRAGRRRGLRNLVRFPLVPGRRRMMRCPGLKVLPGKSRTLCLGEAPPLSPSSTERSTWTGLPPRLPMTTV